MCGEFQVLSTCVNNICLIFVTVIPGLYPAESTRCRNDVEAVQENDGSDNNNTLDRNTNDAARSLDDVALRLRQHFLRRSFIPHSASAHDDADNDRSPDDETPPSQYDEGFDDGEPEIKKRSESGDMSPSGLSDIPEVRMASDDVSEETAKCSSSSDTDQVTSSTPRTGLTVAIPIDDSDQKRDRYLSMTSISTSYTSGIGTCSSVEDHDPSDFEFNHTELSTHPEEMTSSQSDAVASPTHANCSVQRSVSPAVAAAHADEQLLAAGESATIGKNNNNTETSSSAAGRHAMAANGAAGDCHVASQPEPRDDGVEQIDVDSDSYKTLDSDDYSLARDMLACYAGNSSRSADESRDDFMDCDDTCPRRRCNGGMQSSCDSDPLMPRSPDDDDDDDDDDDLVTAAAQDDDSSSRVKMREVLKEYVDTLPLPTALRHFLLFYRV